MTARSIVNERDRQALIRLIETRPLPITVEIVAGRIRTTEQNRLQRRLIGIIAEQIGDDAESVRAYCKLTIGVPILRAENEIFAAAYDRAVRPLPYEQKLALMREPLDMPITRLMTTNQKTRFLDGVMRHFSEQGVVFDGLQVAA